jgi:hypothetical protein
MTVVQKGKFKCEVDRLMSGRPPALLRAAVARVGKNPLDRLRWLLGFCAHSHNYFRGLSQSDLAKLSVEAHIFSLSSGARSWYGRGVRYKLSEYEEVEEVTEYQLTPDEFLGLAIGRNKFTTDQFADLAREMDTTIRKLVSRAGVVVMIGNGIYRALNENFAPSWGGDRREVFRMAALDLLIAEGQRVAQCSYRPCPNLFVRRKRGAYCSKRCSQRARTLRYYEKHPLKERSEKRHAWYVEKVRRKCGPKTVVRRNQRVTPNGEKERRP